MSPDSSIRSAARATSSAHRRIPIRWRLAGGSALLTLVILCGFAVAVGALTSQRIHDDFEQDVKDAADKLRADVEIVTIAPGDDRLRFSPNLGTFVARRGRRGGADRARRDGRGAADDAARRAELGPPVAPSTEVPRLGGREPDEDVQAGVGTLVIQYGRRMDTVEATVTPRPALPRRSA